MPATHSKRRVVDGISRDGGRTEGNSRDVVKA